MTAAVRVLGPVEVDVEGTSEPVSRPQVRHLLALLAIGGGRWVSADVLQDELWPAAAPRSPRAALHVIVTRARDALGPAARHVLVSVGDSYRLDTDRCSIDLLRWEELVAEADSWARAGDTERALGLYAGARSLWRGTPADGVDDSPLIQQERRRLDLARTDAELGELHVLLAARQDAAAAALAGTLLARAELREDVVLAAMQALDQAGRRTDALAAATAFRSELRDALGLSPSPAFDATELALITGGAARGPSAPPSSPRSTLPSAMVGRHHERDVADVAVTEALRSEGGGILFVRGEAGVGVSTFLHDLAARWAAMPDGPPVRRVDPGRARGPSLRSVVGVDAPLPAEGQAGEHLRAIDALRRLAEHHGLLLVIDDVDRLDEWSRSLIVTMSAASTPRVAIVLGARTGSSADIALERATHLELGGLGREAVAVIVRHHWPHLPIGRVNRWAEHVHRWCGGNPMWITEVLAVASAEVDPGELPVPQSAQVSVRRRLSELPLQTRDLLRVAAVLGPVVDLDLVAPVADVTVEAARAALSPAVGDVLQRTNAGRWDFRHDLVRSAIAETVSAADAARWHAAAGSHLSRLPGRRYEAAHHLAHGVPYVDARAAYESALVAAVELRDAGAYAEAAQHFADAAQLARTDAERLGPMIAQGDALERMGDRAAASTLYDVVVAEAAANGAVDVLVRAALAGSSHASAVGGRSDRRSRLRVARRRIDPSHPDFDSVTVELALEIVNARQTPDGELLSHVRRAASEPTSPAHLLARRFCLAEAAIRGTALVDEADRLLEATLGSASTPPFVASACLAVCIGVALSSGTWDLAEEWIDELALLGASSGEPRARWQALAFRSVVLDGRGLHEAADEVAAEAHDLGNNLDMADATATFGLHQLGLAYRAGSLAVLAPTLAIAADRYRFPVWSTLRGLAELDGGSTHEASKLLRSSLPDVLDDRYHFRAATVATATLLAARLGDVAALERLVPAIDERSDRFVMLGYGGPCLGPVDWYRAEAARALGQADDAQQRLDQSIDTCRAAGVLSWVEALRALPR